MIKGKALLTSITKYTFIIIVSIISIFPFYWMIVGATNSSSDITKGKVLPGLELANNFQKLIELIDIQQAFWNSLKVAIITTILALLISSMAGYGFELYQSKVKEMTYKIMLLTMMIPFAALMIPMFRMFAKIGLMDSHLAIILPGIAPVFMIFFFRQNTKSFPKAILDAARVDGLSEIRIFFYIYVPIMKHVYAAAAIIIFMSSWNNYLWPLIVLQSNDKSTLPLVISTLSASYIPDYGVILLAIIIATLPILIVFFLLQRYFVEGMVGSIK